MWEKKKIVYMSSPNFSISIYTIWGGVRLRSRFGLGPQNVYFKETYFKDQNSDTQIYLDKKCEGMQNLFLGTFTTNGLYNCIALLVILFNILQYTTYIEKQISRLFNKKHIIDRVFDETFSGTKVLEFQQIPSFVQIA